MKRLIITALFAATTMIGTSNLVSAMEAPAACTASCYKQYSQCLQNKVEGEKMGTMIRKCVSELNACVKGCWQK